MPSTKYYIDDPQIANLIPTYDLIPSGCPYELTYQVTMQDGSALPSQFTFTSITNMEAVNVYTTDKTLTGVFKMIVKVNDPKTGVSDSS